MKLKVFIILFFICILIVGCAGKEEIIVEEEIIEIIPEEVSQTKKTQQQINNSFYPLKDSMEDLQYQINELKAQVEEYESTLHAPTLNAELLKLIKAPQVEHELSMDNGTIIQGKIINEDADQIILQTRIGQLKIDKTFVKEINSIEPLTPHVVFDDKSLEEKVSKTNLTFQGNVFNEGGRRADFIRVIYQLWETDTKFVLIDSVFVSGNSVIYNNGVISDSCLDPGETGNFILSIDIPDSLKVSYWTKNIKFDTFE